MSGEPFLSIQCPNCGGSGSVSCLTMGQRIKALRLKVGLTQSELSVRIGGAISEKNIGAVETGGNQNPPLTALRAIARVLGVSTGYLIDGENPLA